MEQVLSAQANDAPIKEEKERFFVVNKATLKRPGVILRLASIPVCFLAIIMALALPTVAIQYASYSSSTTFDGARASAFPLELINGWQATFGGGYFSYYLKSKYGPELLYSTCSVFSGVAFSVLLLAILFSVLAAAVTFSKKMEKYSKLAVLGYVVMGIGVLCSPIWFMAANGFGNTASTPTTDLTHYVVYDSLYVHDAFGAIVSCALFVIAAILFAIGGALENAGGDNRGSEQ